MDSDIAHYSAVDLLKRMIRIPSISRDESAVAEMIEQYIYDAGYKAERSGNNIWIKSTGFDNNRPTILLNSHIDTVKAVASWSRDPFDAMEDESGRIFGLGSNDAGASVVSLLHTFFLLDKTEQNYNLIFLASCEEEVSGKNGIESVLPLLPEISFAIVGEPTAMHPAIAEKGLMVIDGTVHGKSGHAARNEGINAIYRALPVIQALRDFSFKDISPVLGPVKISLTQIGAGTQHNVVPDKCTFVVDVRTNECYSNQRAFEILSEVVKNAEVPIPDIESCQLNARSFRLNSSQISTQHPLIKRAVIIGKQPFGSPTLSDQALMGFPSVKMGPGESSRSHSADEFILRDEIREAIEIYVQLLNGLKL